MADRARKLALVRHSLPEMVTGVPASHWHLSGEGRRRCNTLAKRLSEYEPAVVVASEEPKGMETGQIVAQVLNLPFETAPGLHEHERGPIRDLRSQESFEARVASFFGQANRLVFGYETADQAHARFSAAVAQVLERHPQANVVIVTHGTVMTLLIARANDIEPVSLWKALGMPAFAILTLPSLELFRLVRDLVQDPVH